MKYFILCLLFPAYIAAQSHLPDETERISIKASGIKSKTVYELNLKYYSEQDSGFKSLEYFYDKEGQLVYFKRNHIYPELSVSESYIYGSKTLPSRLTKLNVLGDAFQEINYIYNKKGKLKREEYVNYLNTVHAPFYFSILANTKDDTVFSVLQDELGVEPKFDRYSITVNISDPAEENQYVVIGDEDSPEGVHFPWSLLSPETQRKLLEWEGRNKTIHNFKTEYIEKIVYSNDKNGNRLARKVYNTAGDLISSERYSYYNNGKLSGRTKYKSNGSVIFKESYSYDDAGNITEANSGLQKTEYKYDGYGKMTERIFYSGGRVTGKDIYTYDLSGNLESITGYDAANNYYMKVLSYYNDKGLPESTEYYDSENKKIKIVRYNYEFYPSQ